jgi:two-component system chemotaxis response regulator CheY
MTDVLIVEDIGLQQSLLRGFLSGVHTIVGTAETAVEAVALARETDPDAVVMDLNLAEGNGLDATRRIKALDAEIRVVVSTVTVSQETKQAAFEAGADAYLSKPYSQDDLLDAIERGLD